MPTYACKFAISPCTCSGCWESDIYCSLALQACPLPCTFIAYWACTHVSLCCTFIADRESNICVVGAVQVATLGSKTIDWGLMITGVPFILITRAANIFPLSYLANQRRALPLPFKLQVIPHPPQVSHDLSRTSLGNTSLLFHALFDILNTCVARL